MQSCTAAAELQDLRAASSAAVIADPPETVKKRKEAKGRSMWKLAADVHCSLPLACAPARYRALSCREFSSVFCAGVVLTDVLLPPLVPEQLLGLRCSAAASSFICGQLESYGARS